MVKEGCCLVDREILRRDLAGAVEAAERVDRTRLHDALDARRRCRLKDVERPGGVDAKKLVAGR